MALDALAASGLTGTGSSTAAQDNKKLSDDMNTFLLLLTTQLQNQDPLDPMDSNQFTQQLVQFSGVEQAIKQNKNLESIGSKLDLLTKPTVGQAVGFIGKDVLVDSDTAFLSQGKDITWHYTLPQNADRSTVVILDSQGEFVTKFDGAGADLRMGEHAVTWDGTDWQGVKMPNGNYKLMVEAWGPNKDGALTTMLVPITYTSRIDGVAQDNGLISLAAGGDRISMDKVKQIVNPTVN